jgi:hypothetical protein
MTSTLLTITPADAARGVVMSLLEVNAKDGEVRLTIADSYEDERTEDRRRVITLRPAQAALIAANLNVSALNALAGDDTGTPGSIASLHY